MLAGGSQFGRPTTTNGQRVCCAGVMATVPADVAARELVVQRSDTRVAAHSLAPSQKLHLFVPFLEIRSNSKNKQYN